MNGRVFYLDIHYHVVLDDGSECEAFQCRGRSDFPDGTWLRANPHRYGGLEAVEVREVMGIGGREKPVEA